MPANIAVNSRGWMVTSKSCSKLRRIFIVARQARVMVWLTVARRLTCEGRLADGSRRAVVRAVIGRTPARGGGRWAGRSSDGLQLGGGIGGRVGAVVVGLVVARVVTGQHEEDLVERGLLDVD